MPVEKLSALNRPAVITGVLCIGGFALVLFFSSFHLFDSPETWMDEGLIIQSAIGLLHTGKASLPVSPGEFEPAWYITTGFPVTLPLAGVFSVFGVSLEAARLVMLAFLLCLFTAFFLYAHRAIGGVAAWFGFFLLVFFGPLYGDGRNVLGEIPGLLFMMLALLPLLHAGELSRDRALLSGLYAGLAVATKPIFILFLLAFFLALILRQKELNLKKVFVFGLCGVLVPLAVWAFFQFDAVALARVLAVYANPHDVAIGDAILANIKRIFTEMQPLYFFTALLVWCASYLQRRLGREAVPLVEEVLLFFSVLVFLAYLRTAGYYRYFFLGQVFTVLYLPSSLLYLAKGYGRSLLYAVIIILCGLVLFQAYETSFRSWTAVHYNSELTQSLKSYFATRPADEEVFVYQAPELVPFAWGHPIYQYAKITPSISFGEKNVPPVLSGEIPRVMTSINFFQAHATDVFSRYTLGEIVNNYVVLIPAKTVK